MQKQQQQQYCKRAVKEENMQVLCCKIKGKGKNKFIFGTTGSNSGLFFSLSDCINYKAAHRKMKYKAICNRISYFYTAF